MPRFYFPAGCFLSGRYCSQERLCGIRVDKQAVTPPDSRSEPVIVFVSCLRKPPPPASDPQRVCSQPLSELPSSSGSPADTAPPLATATSHLQLGPQAERRDEVVPHSDLRGSLPARRAARLLFPGKCFWQAASPPNPPD